MSGDNKKVILEVLNPRGVLPATQPEGLFAERPSDMRSLRVGLVWHKPIYSKFFDQFAEVLKARCPGMSFIKIPDGFFYHEVTQETADSIDIWVSGIRTTGGDTPEYCANLERCGKPGVMLTCDDLAIQQRRHIADTGLPTMRQLAVPSHALFSADENDPKMLKKIAEDIADDVIAVWTKPLTDEEKNPKPFEYDYGNRFFEGKDYFEANEKYQQFCVDNELGDGLPVTPPTPEAVKRMLTGTSRDPGEVLGRFTPRFGEVTIEKIAINAVMAGAKPEYLPVIIAIIECCMDKHMDFYHISTGSLASKALIVVNGPIAKEIGMNGGMGYLGPGNRANSTIGRALNLCMINLGWSFFKTECPFQGQPQRYTHLIFCENEDESPWESYAVARGFSPEDSTVAIDECVMTDRLGPGGGMEYHSFEAKLAKLAEMTKGMYGSLKPEGSFTGLNIAMTQGSKHGVKEAIDLTFCELAIFPSFAKQLAEHGFTRKSLTQWLCDQHRAPWDEFSDRQKADILELAKTGTMPGLTVDDCKPGGTIPTMNPKHIALFVAGANAGQCTGFYGGGSGVMICDEDIEGMIMKKITGATLTKAGR
jgi:hypothetical protein